MAKADKSRDVEAGTRLPRVEIQEIREKTGLRNNLGESQAPVSSRETAGLKLPGFITSARMPSFRHFLISFTIFAIFAAAYATPALVHTRKHFVASQEEIQFRKLLATISDPALHDALEKYISSKYHPAAGHNDATAGTNQIELAKRQSLNSTITTFTTSSETTTAGPTTSDDTVSSSHLRQKLNLTTSETFNSISVLGALTYAPLLHRQMSHPPHLQVILHNQAAALL